MGILSQSNLKNLYKTWIMFQPRTEQFYAATLDKGSVGDMVRPQWRVFKPESSDLEYTIEFVRSLLDSYTTSQMKSHISEDEISNILEKARGSLSKQLSSSIRSNHEEALRLQNSLKELEETSFT